MTDVDALRNAAQDLLDFLGSGPALTDDMDAATRTDVMIERDRIAKLRAALLKAGHSPQEK